MGIPYSKQINAAFDQVTPLVAEGFEVLSTTRNITLLLAEIQVLTVLLLFLILIALTMLLISINPEMDQERRALVTPGLKWLCSFCMKPSGKGRYGLIVLSGILSMPVVVYVHWWVYFRERLPPMPLDDGPSSPSSEPASPAEDSSIDRNVSAIDDMGSQ